LWPISLQDRRTPSNGGGFGWDGTELPEQTAHNWYFTFAVFEPTSGVYRRQQKSCAAIYGVMLDDIGTKAAPRERLDACPPTYLIETSPGNFQAGYLFREPQTDIKRVAAFIDLLAHNGLCDPGAKAPENRFARLPYAVNNKRDPAHQCRLVEFGASRRYDIDEIIERLELEPVSARTAKTQARTVERDPAKLAALIDANADAVHVPRPAENPVLSALRERGLYKRPLGDGKHDITCPWVAEHTDQVDHGTAYFEPTDLYPLGGFRCQHASCASRRIGALLATLQIGFTAAKGKPTIRVSRGELHRVVEAAESELAQTGRYYQRGGLIVSVVTDPATHETRVQPLNQNALIGALSRVATWEMFDGRSKEFVVTDPPSRHASVLFDAGSYHHLPPLEGIARQPYLRADGSVVATPGYDKATALYGVFDASDYRIPVSPTQDDARAALAKLRALLAEFEFDQPHDEAAALAAFLTAASRAALPTAPMFHAKAATYGSGKSYLTALIGLFASPERPGVAAYPQTDEEATKLLLARLMTAPAVITFDNLRSDLLAHESMCSALTEPHMTGRILGVSKTATVSTRTLFLSSGNNVDPVRDMTRRVLPIVLNPRCETPATRQFQTDAQRQLREHRGEYVSAALTIIRAWTLARPARIASKPWASFEAWSDWCREPLLWLGLPDPAARVFEAMAADPDRETLGRLLVAWHRAFGSTPAPVRRAVEDIDRDLREVIEEIASERGEVNRRRFGRWIARHQNRIVDGLEFRRAAAADGVERWSAHPIRPPVSGFSVVTGVSGVSGSQSARNVTALTTAEVEL
jgi:hypothetical protein